MNSAWIIVLLLIILIITIYVSFSNKDSVYIKSDIDGEYYLVRDLHDKQLAANMLAKIKKNIYHITDHLYANRNTNYKDKISCIEQLNDKIRNAIIIETSSDSKFTSYSVNKGEQIVFCLRSRKEKDILHDFNILMYVVLHEMSHVACKSFGHTDEFKQIFAFITHEAIKLGLYTKVEFSHNPTEYCGMTITDSIV
jgi:predicted metal-dependent hydrolase